MSGFRYAMPREAEVVTARLFPDSKHECDVATALLDASSMREGVQMKLLPSRSLNIPRPPRVDGGGLPLCGMPLTNVAVLQLDGQYVKAAA